MLPLKHLYYYFQKGKKKHENADSYRRNVDFKSDDRHVMYDKFILLYEIEKFLQIINNEIK